jgi:hypothetical protein
MASLHVGLAFWSLLILVVITILINLTLCKDTVWATLTRKP